MHKFYITVGHLTETFRSGSDYGPGETREHWTLVGLEKLIRLGLWRRELNKRGNPGYLSWGTLRSTANGLTDSECRKRRVH